MENRPDRAAYHIGRALDRLEGQDLVGYLTKATEFEHEADLQHLIDGVILALEARARQS